jgi:hypothetical protein
MKSRVVRSPTETWACEARRRRRLGESFRLASSDKPVVVDRPYEEKLLAVFVSVDDEQVSPYQRRSR